MKVYLVKFTKDGKEAYKIGHTKFFKVHKRFEDPQYDIFDSIDVLDSIYITHDNPVIARNRAKYVEGWLQCFFPKNFWLEKYFNTEAKVFDGLSGITEMFIIDNKTVIDEEMILRVFDNVKKHVMRSI